MKIFGLFGCNITDTPSPVMQQAAFRAVGRPEVVYEVFDLSVAEFEKAFNDLRNADEVCCNVTMPYKINAFKLADEADISAELVGAANVITKRDGKLVAYNTDGEGMLRAVEQTGGISVAGKKTLLLGAGGAAAGIAAAFAMNGSHVLIANRNGQKAEDLAADLQKRTNADITGCAYDDEHLAEYVKTCDIVINSTPLGGKDYPDDMPAADLMQHLHAGQVVADAVYKPVETKLLRFAKERGCVAVPGYLMLVYQGASAFTIWTGKPAAVDDMLQAVKTKLGIE